MFKTRFGMLDFAGNFSKNNHYKKNNGCANACKKKKMNPISCLEIVKSMGTLEKNTP